jgi:hypothetical protein
LEEKVATEIALKLILFPKLHTCSLITLLHACEVLYFLSSSLLLFPLFFILFTSNSIPSSASCLNSIHLYCLSITITILYISHGLVFIWNNVSETGVCLSLQVAPNKLGPIGIVLVYGDSLLVIQNSRWWTKTINQSERCLYSMAQRNGKIWNN